MKFSKFFSKLQEDSWYRSFLNPVINEIGTQGNLLDIGTGAGKLIQIVAQEKGITCTGVDTDEEMLREAEVKLKETAVPLLKIEAGKTLPFEDNSFDYITICSVLFHLNEKSIDFIINDALRLLNKDGKIIILTPTGIGNMLSLSKSYFSFKNLNMYIWYNATKKRAKQWTKNQYLKHYTSKIARKYTSQIAMNGFAQVETIE